MKRWSIRLLSLGALLVASQALAIPVPPHPIALQNADGTTVMGRGFGDEHLSWAHDLEGYPLAWDKLDGAWHYATLGPDGRFLALPYRAGQIDPSKLKLAKGLVPTLEARQQALAARRLQQQPALQPAPQRAPMRGAVTNLTILVKFNCSYGDGCATVNRNTRFTPADFQPVLNGATNSVKDYYDEISYGQLQLTSVIAGNQWVQLPYDDDYYAYNDNASGKPEDMVIHAVQELDRQGFDFSEYDANNDGVIDAIHVIHVGPGYESTYNTSCIHSHYADLRWYGKSFTVDGVKIVAYHTEPEVRSGSLITQVGVIVHETGHFFGLPDLYDYSGRSAGLGWWSLMAGGSWGGPSGDGTVPVHADAFSKLLFDFVKPRVISASTSGVVLRPTNANPDMAAVVTGISGQYFLIENRKEQGWDYYIPASGLAIYHVDENQWNDACSATGDCNNNNPDHYMVDLEQPDGRRELNSSNYEMGDSGDVYPYSTVKSITPTSTPNTLAYGQSAANGKISITNITKKTDGSISFDVVIAGSVPAKPNGSTCSLPEECQSGFCADGVCCNTACNGDSCDACSVAAGATTNGTCKVLTGSCDDGNLCTQSDSCVNGRCVGSNPVVCEASGCTNGGTCNGTTGKCSGTAKPNGTVCDDGDACTQTSTCTNGVCKGSDPLTCAPAPACQKLLGCNWQTGDCVYQDLSNGTACDDGDLCTTSSICVDGSCQASLAVACESSGECHEPGVCDPATGTCSDPVSPDGTVCREIGICTAGVCGPKPAAAPAKSGCGCTTGEAGPASMLFALLLGAGLLRRRQVV